jgi:3-hydroxyacyl-CoA dehydrogenase/enoyl-CoA hydratase/carnithine racemase
MVVHVIDFSKATNNVLNPLGRKLRVYIWEQLQQASTDPNVTSIVLTGGGAGNFSAGADLTEFGSAATMLWSDDGTGAGDATPFVPSLIDVVNAIEASRKPVVAAIQGACLGGGLEVALACHYRVAAAHSATKLGLPEVHVGVIPGAGGTQRLPRWIGLQQALSMILTGVPVNAKKALQLKLVDAVVEKSDDLLTTACQWAAWAEVMPLSNRRASLRSVPESPPTAHALCHVASLALPAVNGGGEGVRAALEACRASYTLPFAEGMQREGELFLQVLQSAEGNARRHAFFAVRTAQKMTHPAVRHILLQKDGVASIPTAVIGAGTMGGGIALVLLQAGFSVFLVDVSKPALDKGVAMIHSVVESYVKRKKVTEAVAKNILSRLTATQNLNDLSGCQLVVEAVIEKMEIKQKIFRTLNAVTGPDCILLSNTSTLDIDKMASVLDASRRPLFAGWHFFSPAHMMKLVEIVVGDATSTETTALLQALTKRIGKIGVVVRNCDGFCGNRLLRPYSAETVMLLVEDNATIEQVDRALLNFGMALGPFQLSDLAGNDVGYNIRRERGWVRREDEPSTPTNRPARYTELADDMVSQLGRLGQKTGKGWYDYDPAIGKGRKALPSQEMADFVARYVISKQMSLSEHEIVERVLYPLVNEGFNCLEELIARTPGDIDVVYLYGYGWPAWRGGPMYWADHQIGLAALLNKLQEFHRRFPETDHYEPSNLLERCVEQGMTVEEYCSRGQQGHMHSKL